MNIDNNQPLLKSLTREIDCRLDPVHLFESCSKPESKNRVLLESCEVNTRKNLKSIIVNRSAIRISCNKNKVLLKALTHNGENALALIYQHFIKQQTATYAINSIDNETLEIIYTDTLINKTLLEEEHRLMQTTCIDCLRQINQLFFNSSQDNEYKNFICGLFSFDLIESFEKLPNVSMTLNECPDYVFYLAEELFVIDNDNQKMRIYMNVFFGENQKNIYYDLSRRIETVINKIQLIESETTDNSNSLNRPKDINITANNDTAAKNLQRARQELRVNQSDEEYGESVKRLKQEIIDGNIFQVVPSRTFSLRCDDEFRSYLYLRQSNPSPYMFFMQDQDFSLFGASPESALKYTRSTNSVELYPIAGTRARGRQPDGDVDHDLDKRLEIELKLDQKELSEHMMLVDLARNDIARISKHQSIEIPRLLEIDRYSQVMHLVSCVKGKLKSNLDCFHAYQACMNMGTLTGAPKIKAAELIRKTEGSRRGSYGGAIGYINSYGDMDTCIVIRSAYCKNGTAHIQAGAGVVYDSDPASEARETKQKAQAVIHAIQLANGDK